MSDKKMRRVKFIKELIIEEVLAGPYVEYYERSFDFSRCALIGDDEVIGPLDVATRHIVPVTQFCSTGKPDLFIAYSKQVEELLGIPFRVILDEKEIALKSLREERQKSSRLSFDITLLTSLGWWDRFLFFLGRPLCEFRRQKGQ